MPLCWFSYSGLLWVEQAGLQLNAGTFVFIFLLFLVILLHVFWKAISGLGVLHVRRMYIDSLGKNLALVGFQRHQRHADGSSGGACVFNRALPLTSAVSPFWQIRMYMAKETTPGFLKA